MSQIYLRKLNLIIGERDSSLISLNEKYLVVVLQNENEYMHHIHVYDIRKDRWLCKHCITISEQITAVLYLGDAYLILFDKEYEDGVIDETPNAYFWHPVKGFYQSFYAGRYINSIKIDNDQNIWIGYDEMGIFSMIAGELSERGFNRFDSNFQLKPVGVEKSSPIDHYYSSFVTESYIYLYYCVLGERILKKIDLLDNVIEKRKIDLDLAAICQYQSNVYLFISDPFNYKINQVLKTNDFEEFLELNILDVQTNDRIVFTNAVTHNNLIAGLDENHHIYIGEIRED
ncbi:hypothetical protein [Bacillus pumilus]|uniref:hypothetical protein n=1 Tax=Bacillus pumilus TaxID=1408 RepID=UPI00333A37CB